MKLNESTQLEKKWQKICEDWQKSRLSARKYCEEKKISPSDFIRWRQKLNFPVPGRPEKIIYNWKEINNDVESSGLSIKKYCEEKKILPSGLYKWRKIVKNWEKSGLSKYAYCREKRLNASVFWQWERKFNSHKLRKTSHMDTVERWTAIVENWKKSGLKRFAYCKEHRLTYSSLRRWAERLASPEIPEISTNPMKEPQIKNLQERLDSVSFKANNSIAPFPMGQKIEVTLSQGQNFCLEGPLDWQKLDAWLTPLLTR